MWRGAADRFQEALERAGADMQVEEEQVPLLQIVQQVRSLTETVPAPPLGLLPGRQRFLAEASRLRPGLAARQITPRVERAGRRLAVTLAALVVLVSVLVGGGSAVAGSLPGEALHSVKLAVEEVRLALTTDPRSEADLSRFRAEARLQEVAQLLDRGRPVDPSTGERAAQQIQTALETTANLQEEEAVPRLYRLAEMLGEKQVLLSAVAGEAPEGALQTLFRVMEQARLEAQAGHREPEALRERLRQGLPLLPLEEDCCTPGPTSGPMQRRMTPEGSLALTPGADESRTPDSGSATAGPQTGTVTPTSHRSTQTPAAGGNPEAGSAVETAGPDDTSSPGQTPDPLKATGPTRPKPTDGPGPHPPSQVPGPSPTEGGSPGTGPGGNGDPGAGPSGQQPGPEPTPSKASGGHSQP
jgi:hypothetical protein